MLTRRTLLSAVGAATASPIAGLRAAEAVRPTVELSPVRLQLAPAGATTDALRLAGPEPDGSLRLGLGPTEIAFQNRAAEAVTLVARGLRGSGALDDAPHEVGAGLRGDLRLTPLDPGTGLLRLAPEASRVAGRGGHGAIVVPEPGPSVADRDMTVLLADWLLAADNSLRFGSTPPPDAVASAVTVNGATGPREVAVPPRSRLRLRFASASVQRVFIVSCSGGRPTIAAIDGQPSELFAPARNAFPLGPGARYDLMLDMPDAGGATVRFTSKPGLTIGGALEPERDLLVLRSEDTPLPPRPPLRPLQPNPALPTAIPLETATRVDLAFDREPGPAGRWRINGVPGPVTERPVLDVRRGAVVVMGFTNNSANLLPLRIGGQAVRLLHGKDDGWEPYWRDTVMLPPGGRAHVAFLADIAGRWPLDSGFDDVTRAGLSCFFSVGHR